MHRTYHSTTKNIFITLKESIEPMFSYILQLKHWQLIAEMSYLYTFKLIFLNKRGVRL